MDFIFLADRQQAIPTIAAWYFDQWGHIVEGKSVRRITSELQKYLNRDKIPLMVLAIQGDEMLGVAELKYREMVIYPDKEHWIGGVFIPSNHRGKGVATGMVNKVTEIAKSLGVVTLHLQIEKLDGGLYARLGWKGSEQVNYSGVEVLVMQKRI